MSRKSIETLVLMIFISIFSNLVFNGCNNGQLNKKLVHKHPSHTPKVTIKYENKKMKSSIGEHNWFNGANGNSYLVDSAYSLGKKTNSFISKSQGVVTINFSSQPNKIKILQWKEEERAETILEKEIENEKSFQITLPKEAGEYIFEIYGMWDETHNTSNVFRVVIHP